MSRKDKEWIEAEAMMLVGSAAVLSEYKNWKMLEKQIINRLCEAYKRGAGVGK